MQIKVARLYFAGDDSMTRRIEFRQEEYEDEIQELKQKLWDMRDDILRENRELEYKEDELNRDKSARD